jgi:hypothetical protein
LFFEQTWESHEVIVRNRTGEKYVHLFYSQKKAHSCECAGFINAREFITAL